MKLLSRILFPVILILLTTVISFLNYTPGTFLTGWDTLHPEFNFGQQFSNLFYGVFRTDQGLGAVAAHSHIIEIPRVAFLWLLSHVTPLSFLRYSTVFLSFILGPLGVYFLSKKLLSESFKSVSKPAAFLASLVYIFNLSTVQQFYVPFEMFMAQFASLGWLLLVAISYLEKPSTKLLFLFAVLTFLASPIAYAPVLWYAFFGSFLVFLASVLILKRSKKQIKPALFLILTTLLINSYWLLPHTYFLTTAASNVSLAQTNKLFSDEAFLHNKEFGNILDTAILKNFLFNWTEQIDVNTAQDLMIDWKRHLSNPLALVIGYGVFIIVLAGIAIAIAKRNLFAVAIAPVFFVAIVMIMNMNPPFEFIFGFLRDNFSLFREGLRFPFTKFSILMTLGLSVFFGYTAAFLLTQISKVTVESARKIFPFFLTTIIALSLIFYGWPMFEGRLIDPQMRVAIPQEYFDFYEFMADKPQSARVAPLPIHTLWGWEYYDWGYQGAGFIWFGLAQPVLVRDFDRWNADNEQYFREMSTAIYSRDAKKVEALAQKYKISYFLLDENVVFPGNKQNALWHYETKATFDAAENITLVKQFGDLYLYETNPALVATGFVQIPKDIVNVNPELTGGFVDTASETFGDYVNSQNPDVVYPARSLVSRYDRIDPEAISYEGDTLLLSLGDNKELSLTNTWLDNSIFPEFMRGENYDLTVEEKGLPFTVGDDSFISLPVNSDPVDLESALATTQDCGIATPESEAKIKKENNIITLSSKDGASCAYISFAQESQDFGSMLLLEARNVSGLPIRLCITNNITRRCDIYTTLDSEKEWQEYVFMIPPQPSGSSGYAVHFNNVSIGNTPTENDIRKAQLIQIPYYRIANLSFEKEGFIPVPNSIKTSVAQEINPTLFTATVDNEVGTEGLISLYKAYDGGWHAYKVNDVNFLTKYFPFWFGEEITDHVKVNSWANGWKLSENDIIEGDEEIVIIYLPQYLEYAGFATLILTTLFIVSRLIISKIKK